ncbi:MAG: GNAT family N-acetyltransferase [Ferruginibacter sp.]
MIEVVDYTEDKKAFIKTLNYEWLQKYFSIEPNDVTQLSDPKKEIIDKGGMIFYALFEGQIAGTASLIKLDDESFELGKMATTEAAQGKGVGKILLQHCINAAAGAGARKIILYSNTKLGAAIHLYKKFGFTEIPLIHSHYLRSNILMEKIL